MDRSTIFFVDYTINGTSNNINIHKYEKKWYEIMFGFIKTLSMELLTSIVNVFNSNKCVLLKTKDVDIYIYIYIYI